MKYSLLLAFIWPFVNVASVDTVDYVGDIAAYAAYAGLAADAVPAKPKVPTSECTTCDGTGKVPTGDSNNPWTKCPDCEG